MRKIDRYQIKIYLEDVFNETVYLIKINIDLTKSYRRKADEGAASIAAFICIFFVTSI